jgi:uncharacterized protein (TIGR00730 family)
MTKLFKSNKLSKKSHTKDTVVCEKCTCPDCPQGCHQCACEPQSGDAWLEHAKKHDLSPEDTARIMRYAEDLVGGRNKLKDIDQGVTIFGSARIKPDDLYYKKAYELGRKLAEAGEVVITGGGGGIMEAANRGAFEAGGTSIGLNIKLPHEQALNEHVTDSMEFNYFFARKVMLVDAAEMFVCFPGGFGTWDEFMEVITLVQTKKITKAPIYLFGSEHWNRLDSLARDAMKEAGYISPDDVNLYHVTDDVDEIVKTATKIRGRAIGDAADANDLAF